MLSTGLVVVGVAIVLKRRLPRDAEGVVSERAAEFWRRMATYAVWVWVANSLLGMFKYVDRLMLVHLSGQGQIEVLEQLGTYHVLRLMALLVSSFAGVLSGVLVPHLGHDWESGQREKVTLMLGATVKAAALGLVTAAVVLLALEGFLLDVVFGGKYSGGSCVLPAALAFSVFAGLYSLADPYLLCREKVWLSAVARLVALGLNVVLNALLIPSYQLYGRPWPRP